MGDDQLIPVPPWGLPMHRRLSSLATLLFCTAFVACGGGNTQPGQPAAAPPSAQEAAAGDELKRRAEAEARAAKDRAEKEAAARAAEAERKRDAATAKQRERDEEYAAAQVRYAKKLIAEGDTVTAKDRLQKVVKEYSDTKAAPEARELLERLK
jgi:hypothetical protein